MPGIIPEVLTSHYLGSGYEVVNASSVPAKDKQYIDKHKEHTCNGYQGGDAKRKVSFGKQRHGAYELIVNTDDSDVEQPFSNCLAVLIEKVIMDQCEGEKAKHACRECVKKWHPGSTHSIIPGATEDPKRYGDNNTDNPIYKSGQESGPPRSEFIFV
jgi:hypothetical protein